MPMQPDSLERYLDVAEDEVKAFQGSLVELKNYMELPMHLGKLFEVGLRFHTASLSFFGGRLDDGIWKSFMQGH